MNKRTVVLDARMINHSGIGTYLKGMIPALAGIHDLRLIGKSGDFKRFNWYKDISVLESASAIYSIKEQINIPLKVPTCDIFISPHYNVPLLPVKSKKRVTVIHDVNHLAFYNSLTFNQKVYARIMINSAVSRSDLILTVSEFSKSEILKHTSADEKKIRVVHCGLNHSEILSKLTEEKIAEVKQRFSLPEKFFLFVGNIKPHKNLKTVLKGFRILLDEFPQIHLVAAGTHRNLITQDKEVFEIVENDSELSSRVLFTGYIEDDVLPCFYKLSEGLVFPSIYEGFGLPPIEAMITGTPVIASRLASLPEVCGDAALYVKHDNPAEIMEKLKLLLIDQTLKKKLIDSGIENASRFSIEKFSKKITTEISTL